jgi:fumarate hydratase class II
MLPMIAYNILQSIELLSTSTKVLADKAIATFVVNEDHIAEILSLNPILVTALNPVIGYEKGAEIAKRAYKEKRSVLEIAKEMTSIPETELKRLLDPALLIRGGIVK